MAIQIRRGTDAQWESTKSNIVAGEPAVALDTGRVFVGTGTGTFVELADETTVSALDADINATTTGLKDRMTAAEGDITTIEGTISGLGDASELDYDVVSSLPTTIIQLKDGNTDVYPVGVSSLDYDVISTTDDSVVLADFVVERGTSGIWTYEKWNSGKAVCWGCGTHNVTSWGTWGNVYEASPYKQVGYPSGLFIEAPSVLNITPNGTGGITLLGYEVSTNGTKDISPIFYGLRGSTTASGTIGFGIYARGRWK